MAHSKLSFPEQAAVDCDFCEGHVKVDWYCLTCPANLCEKCKVLHTTRKNFRKHKVLSRDLQKKQQELGEPERVHKCPSHTHNDVAMMCVTCGVPVCNECILSTHNGHVFEGLQAKLERSKEHLSKYLEKLDQKDKSILDQLKKNNEVLKSVDDETQETKKEIIKTRDAAMASVKAESNRLIEQIETRMKENKSSIATSNSKLQSAHDRIQDIIKNAQTKLDGQNSTDIDNFLKEAEKPDYIDISVDKTLSLSTPSFHVQARHTTPSIGTLCFEDHTVLNSLLFPRSLLDVKVIDIFIASIKATEMRAISSTEMWCGHYFKEALQLYDINGQSLNSLPLSFTVQGFVINKMGSFIACDLNDESIKHVTPDGLVSTLCSTSPQKPLGICLNKKEQPVVCVGDSLVIYSSDCKTKVRQFTLDQHENPLLVRVAMNGDTDYCVADIRGKRVVTIDLEGKLRWTYSGGPKQEGFIPYNICCDSHMYVFVADTDNAKVHVLDKDGHFLMYVTDIVKIHKPRGLTVSCDGTLWIGEDSPSRKVHVVKYLSK